MKVRVLFFAVLRERAGLRESEIDVADDADVGSAWETLCRIHPALAAMTASVSFAVNQDYVDRTHRLRAGDEIALIPPVSGG